MDDQPLTDLDVNTLNLEGLKLACAHYGLSAECRHKGFGEGQQEALLRARLNAYAADKHDALPCRSCRFRGHTVRVGSNGRESAIETCLREGMLGLAPNVTAWQVAHFEQGNTGCPGAEAEGPDRPRARPPVDQRIPVAVDDIAALREAGKPWRVRLEKAPHPRFGTSRPWSFYEVLCSSPDQPGRRMVRSSADSWEQTSSVEADSMLDSLLEAGWSYAASTGQGTAPAEEEAPLAQRRQQIARQMRAASWKLITRDEVGTLASDHGFEPVPDDVGDGYEACFDPRPRRITVYRSRGGALWAIRVFPGRVRDHACLAER